jgi:hypothetical protein
VFGLPDHLSDPRDAKLKLADDASNFIRKLVAGKEKLRRKPDVRRALQCVQTSFSFVTQERLFDDQKLLMLLFFFFAFLGLAEPVRKVGEALLPILTRNTGAGHGSTTAEFLSQYLRDPSPRSPNVQLLAGFDDMIQRQFRVSFPTFATLPSLPLFLFAFSFRIQVSS